MKGLRNEIEQGFFVKFALILMLLGLIKFSGGGVVGIKVGLSEHLNQQILTSAGNWDRSSAEQ